MKDYDGKDLKLPMLRDRYEGESMIVPGQEFVYGTTFQRDGDTVLGWYRCTVDPSTVILAWYTDPNTFQDDWRDCYEVSVETKRVHDDDYSKHTYFLPIEDWDVPLKVSNWKFIDISLIKFEVEDPKPIESTLVKPGVSVIVVDEGVYVPYSKVLEQRYDRAMKFI